MSCSDKTIGTQFYWDAMYPKFIEIGKVNNNFNIANNKLL
jgi:hypothetical protein